jgi:TonB family protein
LSAGTAIEQAARAAARGGTGGPRGSGGDYGLGPGASQGRVRSEYDVLSDTMGVDFGPYLARILQSVRTNWYTLIPEVARAPLMKSGKVTIEFAILKDGSVAGMKVTGPSGDVSLDRAAWGGITASNPFPPLPPEFRGDYLRLRFHFYYNPGRNELQ